MAAPFVKILVLILAFHSSLTHGEFDYGNAKFGVRKTDKFCLDELRKYEQDTELRYQSDYYYLISSVNRCLYYFKTYVYGQFKEFSRDSNEKNFPVSMKEHIDRKMEDFRSASVRIIESTRSEQDPLPEIQEAISKYERTRGIWLYSLRKGQAHSYSDEQEVEAAGEEL